MSHEAGLRLAVYNDYSFRREGDALFTDRAFVLFLEGVAASIDRLVLAGQLDPALEGSHYRLSDDVEFVALPDYPSLVHPVKVAIALLRSLPELWRLLDDVDAIWLLGPHPFCLVLALLAVLRRRKVMLGVRQDFPVYVRSRHPGRRLVQWAGDVLEGAYRLMARRCATVVVGAALAENYRRAPRLLQISVSLVRSGDLADPDEAAARSWDGERAVLSVGRLETEKNPLLLGDVLERLDRDGRWRLIVCGEGPLEEELAAKLAAAGLTDAADLRGYVPIDGGLGDLYRDSQVFLHVSWTEGVPQVLLEAFAAGLPVVATDVGGVAAAVGDAALLIPAGDPDAAVAALERLAADPELRRELVRRGLERIAGITLEAESSRVAAFLASAGRRSARPLC